MRVHDLYQYAYVKRPMTEIFSEASQVPPEYLFDWLKDAYDYQRTYSDEELKRFLRLKPIDILEWLEEASTFVWETKKHLAQGRLEVLRDA